MYDAIYARQSVDKKDSVSIEAQIEQCCRFSTISTETYFDKGFSGKSTDRPMMNKLVSDIQKGEVNAVIVYRIDRISRNIVDFAKLLNLFDKHNVKFISASEQFDTSTAMGRAMIYIIMVFAQLERETIAGRIRDNYRFRSSSGKYFMGGNTPYGYTKKRELVDGKMASVIVPEESEQQILKLIFDLFLEEHSIIYITRKLNECGYKTSKGNVWNGSAIRRILMNITPVRSDVELYEYLLSRGYDVTNSEEDFTGQNGMCMFFKSKNKNEMTDISEQLVVIGTHVPCIESYKYIKAQIILTNNVNGKGSKTSRCSFLAGIAKCKSCGCSFGLKSTTCNGKKYEYYYCRGRLGRGVSTCDNHIWIEAREFESTIIEMAKKYLIEKNIEIINYTVSGKENDIEQLEKQVENLIENIGKGNVKIDELLTKKITELQERIDEIKFFKDRFLHGIETTLYNEFSNFEEFDIDRKCNVIRKLVSDVKVGKDKTIEIKYLV